MDLQPFEQILKSIPAHAPIAVALSGGGDSMTLTQLLSAWAKKNNHALHILHVNHGLRPESKQEASLVEDYIQKMPHQTFKILTWNHKQIPKNKIQEQARSARYELMARYCKTHNIKYLCTAHHKNDQAETILFRLAKGSGIDGMAGINPIHAYDKNLTILRPCLNYTHSDLLNFCKKNKLKWLEDKSNVNPTFARVRLRESKNILAAEGLTDDRLIKFASRCERAKEALNFYTNKAIEDYLITQTKNKITYALFGIKSLPQDIIIRLIGNAVTALRPHRTYPASLDTIEIIAENISNKTNGRATIANCLISWSKTKTTLTIEKEN